MANLQIPGVAKQLMITDEVRKDSDETPEWCWRFGIPRRGWRQLFGREAMMTAVEFIER